MAYDPPKYNRVMRRRFRRFVKRWLLKNITPFDPTETFDFEEWLSTTNYPEWRKEQIRKARRDGPFLDGEVDHPKDSDYLIKLFTKEEYYPEYKHHRGIWAREDAAKAVMGPFFHKVEKVLFKLPYFIKKIPKHERPEYIDNFMNEIRLSYHTSDYTSFESHFTTDMMNDCEFELYRHISKNNVWAQRYCRLIFKIIASTNTVVNKYFTIMVDAKRQSGEMNTSLGNGFSNLMFLLFACHYYNIDYSGPIIEGDDAAMGKNKEIPQDYYTSMGLNVKLLSVDDISEASFCGLVYDPQELVNIRDPRETLATLPWVTKKYAFCSKNKYFSLLRSKALSLIYEYPGCPIVYNYGKKIFDLLHEHEVLLVAEDSYKTNLLKKAFNSYVENKLPYKSTGPRTRLLMEKVFDIPISVQISIEKEIENMTIDNFNIPTALSIMPACWINNYNNYVIKNQYSNQHTLNYPMFLIPEKLRVDKIIKLNKGKLLSNSELTEREFYSCRINKDPKLYKLYLWRRKKMKKLLKKNLQLIEQRAVENFIFDGDTHA